MNSIYFLGIGGIGMSALARYFLHRGLNVYGYDRNRSELCQELEQEGCHISYTDDPRTVQDLSIDLVVLTPAIHADNRIYSRFRELGLPIEKRAAVLGRITREQRGLCVAGTHGKTTTTTMLAHLLHQSHVGCSAFLGGISVNYNTNLIESQTSDLVVVEADEFDRSFHRLTPYMAVVTATDADHLDIYGTHEAYLEAFAQFVEKIRPGGMLLVRNGVRLDRRVNPDVRIFTYAGEQRHDDDLRADYHAENIITGDGTLRFDLVAPDHRIDNIELGVPVLVNLDNAVAAAAIALNNGITDEELRRGLASFRGVRRRFEFKHRGPDYIHLDDYAHHPDELSASIRSVRTLYRGRRLLVVFQPHLYTRTRDFYRGFAAALSEADAVVLLPIYPAREEPIPGVTSELVLGCVTAEEKYICPKADLRRLLRTIRFDVLLTVGAGDIGDIDFDAMLQS